jgi:hypothetical protein
VHDWPIPILNHDVGRGADGDGGNDGGDGVGLWYAFGDGVGLWYAVGDGVGLWYAVGDGVGLAMVRALMLEI